MRGRQFKTNQATFTLRGRLLLPGALFRLIVTLPVALCGTALATNTPDIAVCSSARTSELPDRPPGTATVADLAGNLIVTLS